MHRRRRSAVALLTLAGLVAVAPPASAEPVTVDVVVTAPSGAIDHASVTLEQEFEDDEGYSYWEYVADAGSNNDGTFSITAEPGFYRAIFDASTRASGVETQLTWRTYEQVEAGTTLTSSPALAPVTVSLTDGAGDPKLAEVSLACDEINFNENGEDVEGITRSSAAASGTVTLWGLANTNEPCELTADYDGGVRQTQLLTLSGQEANTAAFTLESFVLTGSVTPPGDGPLTQASVTFDGESGRTVGIAEVDLATGEYALRVPFGETYAFASAQRDGVWFSTSRRITVDGAETLDFDVETAELTVDVRDSAGPVSREVELHCFTNGDDQTHLTTRATGDHVSLAGLPQGDRTTCLLDVYDASGPRATRAFPRLEAGGTEVTFYTDSGALIHGDPAEAVDDDGVPAQTEALAAHSGDGNDDGVFDYEQDNVTSLPAFGAAPEPDSSYFLTLAGPAGSSLAQVTTQDPAQLPTPPPSNVSMPVGVASFVLEGVAPASDQVVEIWSPYAWNVNGYAKYDPATQQWSVLPSGRVEVFDDHVAITLTDGGVGDADGLADGRITDPGGLAVISTPADSTPPTVTGAVSEAPNANGWYDGDVTVEWTATDDTSAVEDPADTVVTGEGSDLSATSGEVCDEAGNCTTGTVGGIDIDRTDPDVSVTGPADGASYVLGTAPRAACSASDALSGLDGSCTVARTGGRKNGVGSFVVTARATDKAGNETTQQVTYQVTYRFDGFLQPINDPLIRPTAPMSVFPAGKTVPVSFVLKRASGGAVLPTAVPRWVTPERGASTRAKVNESASAKPGTKGTAFTLKNGRWHFDWSTKGITAGYEYRIGVALDDGTTHYVTVAVR
jgi:hypothetical protein